MAVHREARALRSGGLRLGRGVAGRRRSAGQPSRRAVFLRRPARLGAGRRAGDDLAARPPPSPLTPVDPAACQTPSRSTTPPAGSASATTATSASGAGRGPDTGRRAASTAEPTPRSQRAGSRTRGPPRDRRTCSRRSMTGSAGMPTWRSSRTTAPRSTTPATPRTRCSRSGWVVSGSCRPVSTRSTGRSSASLPVAPPTGASSANTCRSAWTVTE